MKRGQERDRKGNKEVRGNRKEEIWKKGGDKKEGDERNIEERRKGKKEIAEILCEGEMGKETEQIKK